MLEAEDFTFNNISSQDMGVTMINSGGGLYTDIFLPNRNIIESSVPYRSARSFKRVEREPVSFPLSFHLEKWESWQNIRAIVDWFDTDDYVPFFINSDPNRIYYIIIEGTSELIHNGAKDGYVNLTARSLYPFALSPEEGEILTIREGNLNTLEIANLGDSIIRPRIKLTKVGNGDISILNSQNNQELVITGLFDGEIVEIDCENELIRSSLEESANRYLYNNHNDVWLDINKNIKTDIVFSGEFDVDFRYELIYKNETR